VTGRACTVFLHSGNAGPSGLVKKIALFQLCACVALLSGAVCGETLPHCFNTNEVRVCHDPRDESIFYDTPISQVAYNVQTLHDDGNYYTIYHGEPKGEFRTGDAIKVGVTHGAYTFRMPSTEFRLWGPQHDPQSLLDSDGVGGGGNPMTISGRPGDPYFYVFFLGVSDDERTRDHTAADWRHYLLEVRTKDFVSFDLKTEQGWAPFGTSVKPGALKDTRGQIIRSNTARAIDKTQGLIGSISYMNGVYHYFYLDYALDGGSINLYHRTSVDIGSGSWSPPEVIQKVNDFEMIRVAKAKNLPRWAVMYGCYVHKIQDVCLQYTKTLDVFGPGGISALQLTPDFALDFSGDGKPRAYVQPYWLTDRWGNLDTVEPDTGGEMYWTDMTPSNCLHHPYPYCPVAGGRVYRAGWTISVPSVNP
jgi:hypothetical protein